MKKDLIATTFITPYPQEALDGELGLTSQDIARSLCIEAKTVRHKIRERRFLERLKKQGYQAVRFVTVNESNGLEFEDFILDVRASKAFVARYNNDIGWGYLDYLFTCERKSGIAEIALIEAKKALDAANQEIKALNELVGRLTRAKRYVHKGVKMISLTIVNRMRDIFGDIQMIPEKVRVPYDSINDDQKRDYRLRHRTKIIKGLANANEKDQNKVIMLPDKTVN